MTEIASTATPLYRMVLAYALIAAGLVGTPFLAHAHERQTVAFCSRAGCTATVVASGDLGTEYAWLRATFTEDDAVSVCEDYAMPDWREQGRFREFIQCVERRLKEDGGRTFTIRANCIEGELTLDDGSIWRKTGSEDLWTSWEQVGGEAYPPNAVPPIATNDDQHAFLCGRR